MEVDIKMWIEIVKGLLAFAGIITAAGIIFTALILLFYHLWYIWQYRKQRRSQARYKYRVEWNDHEGNQHEYTFDNIADAESEEDSLRETYSHVYIKLAK